MKNKYLLFSCVLVLALLFSVQAIATPTEISPNDGWHEFFFHGTSDYSDWINSFHFVLSGEGDLRVTDAFFPGDVFKIYKNGVLLGPSNNVFPNLHIWTDNPDYAYYLQFWSRAFFSLDAGDYLITGTAKSFVPYIGRVGGGFLMVEGESLPPGGVAPLPPSVLLMFSGLLGLAGWRRLAKK